MSCEIAVCGCGKKGNLRRCLMEDKAKWLSLMSSGRLVQLREMPSSASRRKAPSFRTRYPLSAATFDTVTFYWLSIRLMEEAKALQKASFPGAIRMNDGIYRSLRKMMPLLRGVSAWKHGVRVLCGGSAFVSYAPHLAGVWCNIWQGLVPDAACIALQVLDRAADFIHLVRWVRDHWRRPPH